MVGSGRTSLIGRRVQAVPLRPHSFELRLGLAEEWRGLTDAHLVTKSEIEGSVYVHHKGWIAGNRKKEGAIALARKTILLHQIR